MRPPLPAGRTKLFYALGAIAFRVKDNGFGVFLLLYYNQVLGLPAGLAGTALLVALYSVALTLLSAYNITRASHAAALEALARRRGPTKGA
jgi:Na+/melibiose symporter-like transporter